MISKDWLRHSTVDRRTLRPLSMVHFDPCQRPCCPVSTSTSVQQTCNTQMSRKIYQAAALQRNMASCTRAQETTCKQTAKQGRGNQRWGKKINQVPVESWTTIPLIFTTHPLYTLLDLHLPPSLLTPLLTHFSVCVEAGMSSLSASFSSHKTAEISW